MIWTGWLAVALVSYLGVVLVREQRNPGERQRKLIAERPNDIAKLRRARRDIANLRGKLTRLKKERTTWFGDIWFKQLVLWTMIRIYHLWLRADSIFDEFDRFHDTGEKPDRVR
jgi:hypothetical protein